MPREEYVETTDPDYAAQIVRISNQRPTRCGIGYLITRNLSNHAYSELLMLKLVNAKLIWPTDSIVEENEEEGTFILAQNVQRASEKIIIF